MTTFSGQFLGCKVSQTDLQAVRERLADDGLEPVEHGGAVHVVNGCCVTREAVAKTRKEVRRALRRSDAVVVTGCAANLAGAAFADLGPRVHVLRRRSEETPDGVADLLARLGCRGGGDGAARPVGLDRVRAFLKVQDGCSFSCSYCVVPLVRGATRSRPVGAVLAEARRRVAAGHRELVLTGINIGCYRDRDARLGLAGLVERLAAVDGLERLRISSIEVNHLTESLLRAIAHTDRLAPHLHVPLQSGDDAVLAAMRRRYTRARFLERMARVGALLPEANLSTDVIVGFPGEDEAAFAGTLDVVSACGFSRVHAFPYSPRPGTATAGADPVRPEAKRERAERLRAFADGRAADRAAAWVGRRGRVLVERAEADGSLRGYGADYTPWRLAPAGVAPGTAVDTRAEAADGAVVLGRVA